MMRTSTIVYLDAELDHFHTSVARMEETGWSVRQAIVLEPVHEKFVSSRYVARVLRRVISVMVVYEKEHA